MIYTPLTNKALRLAYDAHHGQVDKSGQPYFFQPYHLAEQMEDEISVCVALLHDVVEDTSVTMEELEREVPTQATEALRLLTHEAGTDYLDYVRAIMTNYVARKVKMADLAHNSDETRFAGGEEIEEEQLAWWRLKYARARELLEEPSDGPKALNACEKNF